ncbi:hypothetical protein TREMEDRAFT_62170 [Tremella mesenterica DSM 1558]|uniref:uncharacterized protein n=1 Tax=Tremella mesenterica (strain ATCC 24925 / CBS 8224 / DSM 1558 / NBRC 9311 / NRRL Y-6157 / RJB 2259-6 / UBC 559-6) TaxID=578456 RepID=UPI0003F49449|nr:uncharacterized protein TREMEDRAFT_62170 [Tremella mesenterica DSM 1558]EIW69307.1 hypothetical protein TREMEDRAFT_62170 [Tremella mesenterica DSM 1558]
MPGQCYSPISRARIAQKAMTTPYRQVAAAHGCSVSTVSRLVTLYHQTGNTSPTVRPGPSSRFNERTLCRIKAVILQNRRKSPRELVSLLGAEEIKISLTTLRVYMKRMGFKQCVARKKPFLDSCAKRLRLSYAKKHANDTLNEWHRTIFVDEVCLKLNWTTRWRAYGGGRIVEDNVRVHTCGENRDQGKKQCFKYTKFQAMRVMHA